MQLVASKQFRYPLYWSNFKNYQFSKNYIKFTKQWCKSHLSKWIRLEMAEKRKSLSVEKIIVLVNFQMHPH